MKQRGMQQPVTAIWVAWFTLAVVSAVLTSPPDWLTSDASLFRWSAFRAISATRYPALANTRLGYGYIVQLWKIVIGAEITYAVAAPVPVVVRNSNHTS